VLLDGPVDPRLAHRAATVLESAYARVGRALSTFPSGVITVVLYTEQEFRNNTRSPSWAAAAFDGRIRIPVRGGPGQAPGEFERVLTHEVTHALVRSIAARGVPAWLSEGLAVIFEPDGPEWAQRQLAAAATRIPLEDLTGSFDGMSGRQARLAYAESADAARRLFDRVGGAGVAAVLQDIARGIPVGQAFEQRTLSSYSSFAIELDSSR
jgi:hypothetical protein